MTLQEQYDDAMFDFSRGGFEQAITKLNAVLAQEPAHYEAQLALGMAYYRQGELVAAIREGHKAEQLRPKEQLVHTNLSLFYMKSGDKVTAEHHGLQARIAGWREDAARAKQPDAGAPPVADPELEIAGSKPQAMKLPAKFPEQPWKKKNEAKPAGGSAIPPAAT
jgi:Flp pilus assembly protein TadD